jgi:hypothetical protein
LLPLRFEQCAKAGLLLAYGAGGARLLDFILGSHTSSSVMAHGKTGDWHWTLAEGQGYQPHSGSNYVARVR